jgi:hypothetical protein
MAAAPPPPAPSVTAPPLATAPPTVAPEAPPPAEAEPGDADETLEATDATTVLSPEDFPRACPTGEPPCVPAKSFVDRLCSAKHAGAALVMFEKSAPWEHAFIRMREVKAVNTLGGPAGAGVLPFAEEVLIVGKSGGGGGGGELEVSGSDGYIVLRWDGTCATLTTEEVVGYEPGFPPAPAIVWNHIDPNLQEALLASTKVKQARTRYRTECKGQRAGNETGLCKRATDDLSRTIAAVLRTGFALPDPEHRP